MTGSGDGTRASRIASLDWVRGWMLIASVAANSLLVIPRWFDHTVWDGVHLLDLIFPVFVTLSGCGLAFAMHRRVAVWPLVRRVVVLLVVGQLYGAITSNSWEPSTWTLTGVLQLYAFVVALLGVLHLITRSWLGWAVITVVLAAGYTVVLAAWAVGCGDLGLTRTCNPSGAVDPAVFGAAHIYHQGIYGHDPVGLMAGWGALVSASAGATMGHVMLAVRERGGGPVRAALPLLACVVGALLLAQACIQVSAWIDGAADVLVMKRLWTPPFALRVAAPVAVALLIGHLLLDGRRESPAGLRVGRVVDAAASPLIALGRNSLLVYFGSHIVMSVLSRPLEVTVPGVGVGEEGADVVVPTTLARELAEALAVGGQVQLTWTCALLLFWTLLAGILHRARLYLRP
ncbi:heparan-alpha-glucosaminide N-acetyltransferase domain-containing protein [Herbiconiux sp. P15]|uniref:heparan-alpha-glucosaminide N-acetyltransferase domain-containing protein n=1 Tax=Herbiconiux liukaitaii TaxID=3342799 RepID=UPI0035B7D121